MKKIFSLFGCALVLSLGAATPALAQDAATKSDWDKNCAYCHGKEGKGDSTMGKKMKAADLTSEKIQKKFEGKQDQLESLISDGLSKGGKVIMKPLKSKLKKEEIKSLAQYVLKLGKKKK